jgi:tRNA1(Val) A37 N6-methylase TrmN6
VGTQQATAGKRVVTGGISTGETLDAIGRGRVRLYQRRDGYRFSIDSVLLAQDCGAEKGRVADLGTGCGVIPLLLVEQGARQVTAVELQHSLCELARRNVVLNGRATQIELVEGDLRNVRSILPGHAFDLVVSNPPYRPVCAAPASGCEEVRRARFEETASIEDVAAAAAHLVKPLGRVKIVYPTAQMMRLQISFFKAGLGLARARHVHHRVGEPSKILLAEFRPQYQGPLEIRYPLVLTDEDDRWSPELAEWLADADAPPRPAD